MKNHKLSIFILPLLFLASCQGVDSVTELNEAKEAVSSLTAFTETKYDVKVEGHVSSFTGFEPKSTSSIPKYGVTNTATNRSYMIRTPMVLTADNFYPSADVDENADTTAYSYNRLISRLESGDDKIHKMEFEKDGDDLVFFINGVSKFLKFYNVYTDKNNPDVAASAEVYSRFDIKLVYGSNGLLKTEKVTNCSTPDDSQSITVDILSTYTYSA